MPNSFQKKLEKILNVNTLTEETVKPEKGEDVTHGVKDGTGKIDATGPVPKGAAATLKTSPGATTSGPTGHIPTNSDLPKKYSLGEEKDEEDKEDVKEEKKPPFFKKKGESDEKPEDEKSDKKDKKSKGKKEDDKEKLDEEADKDGSEANSRAGFTKKSSGDGEKMGKLQKEEKDEEEDEKSTKSLKSEEKEEDKEDKKAIKEAVVKLFDGETLSEAFKVKTSTIFEDALSNRIKETRKKLTEKATKILNERVEQIREELAQQVNGHLDLVVENWVSNHEVPLVNVLKSQMVESFIGDLKSLYESYYFEVPNSKVDVVAEMANRITSLEQKLNEQLETNAQLVNETKSYKKSEIIGKVSKNLSSTQVEKLKTLTEKTDFISPEQFEQEVNTLKESLGNKQEKTTNTQKNLAEQTLDQNPGDSSEGVSRQHQQIKEVLARLAKN